MRFHQAHTHRRKQTALFRLVTWTALILVACGAWAVVPPPERLLPDDTLVLVTAPDFAKLKDTWSKLPQSQCWNDPAMKLFKEKFLNKWKEEFKEPLERELSIKIDSYIELLQGQLTFAVTRNGWQGQDDQSPGLLFLLDSKDKSNQLKKNLADLRNKWVDAGKNLKTEKIRDVDFTVLLLSSNDMPKTLRKLFPKSDKVEELGDEKQPTKDSAKDELIIGQVESLLILGNSTKAVEKVVSRLTGGSVPPLADQAAYQANHMALFRNSPLYAWVNAKAFIDLLLKEASQKKENPDAPNPFDLKPDKVITALGLSALKTIALSFQDSNEGEMFQVLIGAPETSRQGILKLLAGEPKETMPPSFVPADAVKFQRWRIDGQKAWAALEKMLTDISPQMIGGVNFLIDSANNMAKEKDPGFDIRKTLLGNLGDDLISYEKASRGKTIAEWASRPSIYLLGSPNPEQFAGALKSILVFISQQTGTAPEEREFLGRKIYSLRLGAMGLPGASGASPSTLHYAAGGSYVALSTDVALVEEYLRSSETQGKTLRETPGLAEAAQHVTGPGSCLFGYQNETETMKALVELLRKEPAGTNGSNNLTLGMPGSSLGVAGASQAFKDWLDFSLLPPFEKIAKYFSISVYGGGATTEGLNFKMFEPVPPGLRR
jgi:hypothetical protein